MQRLFILSCCLWTVWGQLQAGDRCTTSNGQNGECSDVSKCIAIQSDIHKRITNHVVCGHDGYIQIACCPSAESMTVTTTATSAPTRISVKKCDEYNEFSFNKISITNTFGPSVVVKKSNCAFKAVPLIVGGTEAKIREFPHMLVHSYKQSFAVLFVSMDQLGKQLIRNDALIGFEDISNITHWDCGGTLISEQFVLSAAHCFDAQSNGPAKYVRLGEHDQNRVDDGTTIDLRIIQIILHPEYKYPSVYNDIALFKLERRIELSGAIRPACLPQVSAVPTKTSIASGWGAVTWRGKESSVLLKVVLDMFTQNECNNTYMDDINRKLKQGILDETQVCAGSYKGGRDTCQGDSGGPLQIYHETHACSYIVVGVTSLGKNCGTPRTPGVYTRVYAYLGWIEGIVWPSQ